MRRGLVLGVGLAGALTGSAAVGQIGPGGAPPVAMPFGPVSTAPATAPPTANPFPTFTGGRAPSGSPAPTGFQPAAPAAPAASPAPPVDIPSALGPSHPWVVKPENGTYFICVKSYSRPAEPDPNDPGATARELAEALAGEIRETHRVAVYLYEHVTEERRMAAQAAAAARQQRDAFLRQMDTYRQRSQLQGMEFLGTDSKLHYRKFKYRDQIAVLVGGFPTEEEARKALDRVRTWPSPKNQLLMDGGAIATYRPNAEPTIEKTRLNPYPTAMVVPNPVVPRHAQPTGGKLDPLVLKLNEGRPYSLLQATKGWTLGVRSFTAPVAIQSKDADTSLMTRMGLGKGADVLQAGAEQAEMLAKALRAMRRPDGRPLGLEAFVLHTRNASIVTVGQFDGPDDPALHETRRLLKALTFTTSKDERGTLPTGTEQLFGENLMAVPVPRP